MSQRTLKIYSNKKNNRYKHFVDKLIKHKNFVNSHDLKVRVFKSEIDLVVELCDFDGEVKYRTRKPHLTDIRNKLLKLNEQKKSHKGGSVSYPSCTTTFVKPTENKIYKQMLKDKIKKKIKTKRKHTQIDHEINETISANNQKMSVYIKNNDNHLINKDIEQKVDKESGQINVFIKPVVKQDDKYKYDENGNFIKGLSGIGYKNEIKAEYTIKLTQKLLDENKITPNKQMVVIKKMYDRAKNHKYQTPGMRNAVGVYKEWLDAHGMETEVMK